MKVCFKLTQAGSGSDIWTYMLAEGLKTRGVSSTVDVIPHHYQYCPDLIPISYRRNSADIVHTNSWNGFAFREESKKLVTTEHLVVHDEMLRPYKSFAQAVFHRMVHWFETRSFMCADRVTAVSQHAASQIKSIFGVDSLVIHNGINTNIFKPVKLSSELVPELKDKFKLLFVGNFTKRKGADLLPEIMAQLGDDFVLLTTTGLQDHQVAECTSIISIGSLNHESLSQFYNYCDVFLFPSRMEGFGLTVAEAMACAKPVVTTNVSALPELVDPKQGGVLTAPGDVVAIVNAIRQLKESPLRCQQMGAHNLNKAKQQFSIDTMVDKYLQLYEELV